MLDLYEKRFCLLPYFVFHVRVVDESLMRDIFFLGIFSREHWLVWYQIVAGGILSLMALNSLYYRYPQVAGTLGKRILTRMDLDICKVT